MVKHNIRIFAFAIIGLAFFVYAIIFLITQNLDSIDFHKALTHISTTISINIILWMIFIFWAWKWKVFYPWLVQTPDLSGKWKGKIKSNFDKENSKPISTEIDIKQDFFIAKNEDIVYANPDVIIALSYLTKEEISQRRGWQDISAVKYGNIYTVDDIDIDTVMRTIPRSAEALLKFNQWFLDYDKKQQN